MKFVQNVTIGTRMVSVGDIIEVVIGRKIAPTKVLQISHADIKDIENPKGWNSPWAKVQMITGGAEHWVSLNNWFDAVQEGVVKTPERNIQPITGYSAALPSNNDLNDFL